MGYSIKRDPVSAHAPRRRVSGGFVVRVAVPRATWRAHQVSAEESPRIELRRSVNSCRFSPIFPSGMLNLTGVGIPEDTRCPIRLGPSTAFHLGLSHGR